MYSDIYARLSLLSAALDRDGKSRPDFPTFVVEYVRVRKTQKFR